MAASTVPLPCFKLHHQPYLLHGCNYSSNQTLLRFNFSPPKPLYISSSRRFRVLPETITAKLEEEVKDEEKDQAAGDLDPPAAVNTKLYFGNLPYNVDSATLAQIIQDFANPELVEVLYNRDTGQSRGFAFVTMRNVEDCNIIIDNLDGTEYLGRALKVNFADKPKPNKEPLYPETKHKLFIGNLSWTVTSESLAGAFRECGDVVGARVVYDGDTGRSRGYGFVCYSSKAEMDAALESLDGFELEGREIRVNLAQGKKF
ncbi:PREDICTED: RNA-binding protein CP31B, chloroplastic-like isoform X1 [Camelina sativa]|uniref:RNA-binding protein CP31B, chloroplastic-like isoform X1 n=1 Tax=Camelina sativa TaxID=90675 RepID=A0ABM0WF25_CAMSA|nr:PREDICTED: RNA-binding protein CP31B, chloroplastic-like isoform X1 [Camelina sativa]